VRGGLTRRTISASGLLALIVGSAFAVLLLTVAELRDVERHARQSQEVLVVANRLERLIVDAETALRGFVITEQTSFLEPWHAAHAAFPEQAATLQRLVADNPAQLARAAHIARAAESYHQDYAIPLVESVGNDPASARTVAATEAGKRRLDAIRAEFDDFVAAEDNLAEARQAQSDAVTNRAVAAAAGGLAGSVLLIVLFGAYLTTAIVRPVRLAAAMAGRLAGGDLDVRLPDRGRGEIGLLERSFNTMARGLQDSRRQLTASRRRIVAAADQARRRIERDLHDGTQQRLVSLVLNLRAAEATAPAEPAELRRRLAGIAEGLVGAVDDLRVLSRGIHPAILSEGGLRPALAALARRSAVPVELDVAVPTRLPEAVEVAAYYVVSEALSNVAKHAQASSARVTVRTQDGSLHLAVRDDGLGGADAGKGSGLTGLIDRVEALGGTISVTSPPGRGTALLAEFPVESR
jgi:signal transduction histidine kinase